MSLPVPVRRALYRVAYVLLMIFSRVVRPRVRGVKCLVVEGDEILVVRHAYGPRQWDLPGGFCRRGEEFGAAARREIREELGLADARWTDLGRRMRDLYGRHENLGLVRAEVTTRELVVDRAEIAETRWVRRDRLPSPRSETVDWIVEQEEAAGLGGG